MSPELRRRGWFFPQRRAAASCYLNRTGNIKQVSKGLSEPLLGLMTNLSPLAQPTPSERTLFRSIHSQFDPKKTRAPVGIFLVDLEREMLFSPVTSCKTFSTNFTSLRYFLPCTEYRRFCQCNCCNSSQISSRHSLQTHRSSGCQR